MEYTALYRKFRPLTFSELVGQDHITKTLKNQIKSGRIGHAYLFNGGRGTGKTSSAKIFARAINCLNPKDGEPCNECEICKAMLEGSLTDVVEMDAASNNSVEDIRSIRDEVNFLPTLAKYRVYIIDEVHMLSTGAFNALLKTLEEPPAHVKFILATTEPQKLPATILSRCQRFDFKRISDEDIVKRLKIVCEQSQIQITEEALNIIAVLAEGAARDALSILERCSQEQDGTIDGDLVKALVGIPKITFVNKIVEAIISYKSEEALQALEEVLQDGKDLNNLLWEIIKYVKDILVYKTSKNLNLYNKEELAGIEKLSANVSKERLINLIYELSEIENNIKWSSQKEIMLQTGIIKLSTNVTYDGIEELKKKVQDLENKINSGNITVKSANSNSLPKESITQKQETKKVESKANIANLKSEEYWPKVVNSLKDSGKMILYSNLVNTKAKQKDDLTIEVIFPNGLTKFGKDLLQRPENMKEIVRLVSMECGKEMRIQYIDAANYVPKEENSIEDMVKKLDIPVNIIEE
ncbi:MAG: DNA polymerase III subunit gamma/tau [Clostridia bacterium]|nr:DNA polymerase III subunit gamma/tau [Clostridia bacterium]